MRIVRHVSKRQQRGTSQPSSDPDSESEIEHAEVLKERVRTRTHEHGGGEKIIMTEDEDDDPYEKWKTAKANEKKHKRTASKKGAPPAKKMKIEQSSVKVVGKRTANGNAKDRIVGKRSMRLGEA